MWVAFVDVWMDASGGLLIAQNPGMFSAFNCSMKRESRACWSGEILAMRAPRNGGLT
jgi:hypothetical protein